MSCKAVEILENFTTADFARVGEEASENFFLKQGPLEGPYGPFQHTLEPTFRNYGLPTRLNRGAIELLRDCEVPCRIALDAMTSHFWVLGVS